MQHIQNSNEIYRISYIAENWQELRFEELFKEVIAVQSRAI